MDSVVCLVLARTKVGAVALVDESLADNRNDCKPNSSSQSCVHPRSLRFVDRED